MNSKDTATEPDRILTADNADCADRSFSYPCYPRYPRSLRICFERCVAPVTIAIAAALTISVHAAEQRRWPTAAPVWPAPPQEARITYLQSIAQPADFGVKRSGWSRFVKWVVGSSKEADRFIKPFGIALDEADNVCFTDTGANVVCCFDVAEKKWHRWERIEKIRFSSPVAVAKRGEKVFVADSALRCVLGFTTKGKLLFVITNGLERPSGLTISGDSLFVVDSQLSQVFVFDLQGKPLSQFGKRGGGPGEFNYPTHIAADRSGGLLLTDSLNGRLQVLDKQGQSRGQIGSAGDSPGHFGRPKGAAADSGGRVYVLDALFDNLQIFEPGGRLLLSLGEAGSQPGQFWLPNGIAISRDNRIFIADSYNQRIQVLKYIGGP